MSLIATVHRLTGKTRHGALTRSGIIGIPTVVRVRIEEGDGGYYLFRFTEQGDMVSDTWHTTVDEAKHQAEFEYEISTDGWSIATDPDHNGPQNPGAVT